MNKVYNVFCDNEYDGQEFIASCETEELANKLVEQLNLEGYNDLKKPYYVQSSNVIDGACYSLTQKYKYYEFRYESTEISKHNVGLEHFIESIIHLDTPQCKNLRIHKCHNTYTNVDKYTINFISKNHDLDKEHFLKIIDSIGDTLILLEDGDSLSIPVPEL